MRSRVIFGFIIIVWLYRMLQYFILLIFLPILLTRIQSYKRSIFIPRYFYFYIPYYFYFTSKVQIFFEDLSKVTRV